MRTYDCLTLRWVLGQPVVMDEGRRLAGFDKVVALNDTAALLWESVAGRDFSVDDLADALVSNYGIDRGRALDDANYIAEKWISNGLAQA